MRRRSVRMSFLVAGSAAVALGVAAAGLASTSSTTTAPVTLCVSSKGAVTSPGAGNACPARTTPLQVGSAADVQALAERLDALENATVAGRQCAAGQYVSGVDATGGLVCVALPTPSASASPSVSASPSGSTAPPAPTGVTATQTGSSTVVVAWSAASGATSYEVLRSTSSGSGHVLVASGVVSTQYLDATVTNGTTYYYVVRAVNQDGTSPSSEQASVTPVSPPAAPAVLTAEPGSSPGTVSLAWSQSATATSYSVLRGTSSGGPYVAIASQVLTTQYVDSGRTAGVTYYYVVRAANGGGVSPDSPEASAVAPV